MGYIEGENRYQIILFPESMDDYISENNPVRARALAILHQQTDQFYLLVRENVFRLSHFITS